jgi:hypothetical protein
MITAFCDFRGELALGAAKHMVRYIFGLGLMAAFAALSGACASAQVVYRFSDKALFDGRYGPVAQVQEKANSALVACGHSAPLTVDGQFGPGTRTALATLATCPAFAPILTGDTEARAGTLTAPYWTALVGGAPPDVDARARTLMLTYEDTDYIRMEWNFCQSKPRYNPAGGAKTCFSNDPRSYLTWGPNGATGGGGREVQLILQAIDAASPDKLATSFGSEQDAVRRMFKMLDRTADRTLETYLCGVWANPSRREAWKTGFQTIGRVAAVRATFDNLYKSASLDGGKIRTFMNAYAANGRVPTEIDYAFFKDRSAHTSPELTPIRNAIADVLRTDPQAPAWKVRRAIALKVRPTAQRTDRLGRDVAFYIDGATLTGLSAEERQAWTGRGKLHASDVGLSDSRSFATFTPGPTIVTTIANPATLTSAERAACPAAVLATQRPPH